MALLKVIISTVAIIIALSIAVITMTSVRQHELKPDLMAPERIESKNIALHSKRASRFLAQNVKQRNPNAADHCHKDHEICNLYEGNNSTCCNNKCVDLAYDSKNCGACKNKCKFTLTCCRGECVDLAYDKRHCGSCSHRCDFGEYCVHGMCNYA